MKLTITQQIFADNYCTECYPHGMENEENLWYWTSSKSVNQKAWTEIQSCS